jgi:hypothetical protein
VFHKPALYQGTTLVVPKEGGIARGFNPCGTWLLEKAAIYETRCSDFWKSFKGSMKRK